MSDKRLTDAVLGTLFCDEENNGIVRVAFTPKHEVEVVVSQLFASAGAERPALLRWASETYQTVRRLEWENRLLMAETAPAVLGLLDDSPSPPELARQFRLVRIHLGREAGIWLIYQGMGEFEEEELTSCLESDGTYSGIQL
jgi:hypothetical protein